MRCLRWSADDRLHATETDCRTNHVQPAQKWLCGDTIFIQFEGQHGPEPCHLGSSNVMTFGVRQPGVINFRDRVMAGEEFGNPLCILSLPFHSYSKRFQAPFKQVTGDGIETAAQMSGHRPDSIGIFVRCDCDSATKVAMPSQIFGTAVYHHVYSQRERVLVDGCCKSIVNNCHNPPGSGKLRHATNVYNPQ